MRLIARPLFALAATAIVSTGASAGEIEAASKIDSVTVYPDAAIVTRVAEVDLSQGDNVLVFKDLPLALDPASLRLEGSAGAALAIGAVETRVVPADAKAPDDAFAAKIAALRDERESLQTTIDALQAKRAMIVRFSQSGPKSSRPTPSRSMSAPGRPPGTPSKRGSPRSAPTCAPRSPRRANSTTRSRRSKASIKTRRPAAKRTATVALAAAERRALPCRSPIASPASAGFPPMTRR